MVAGGLVAARDRQPRHRVARRLARAREPRSASRSLLILGGLAALIAIIGLGGGFIPAIAILFAATAAASGGARSSSTSLIGSSSAPIVYLLFSKLLTLSLPWARSSGCCEDACMDTFARSCTGHGDRASADEPAVRADRRAARHRGRRAARHRPRADRRAAAARHLQARSRRLADHVRRHLLRRHVWRLDHRDPDQHAGRKRVDGDRARRQQDGEGRARRPGARDRRDRLVRRRHARDHRRSPSSRPGWSRSR